MGVRALPTGLIRVSIAQSMPGKSSGARTHVRVFQRTKDTRSLHYALCTPGINYQLHDKIKRRDAARILLGSVNGAVVLSGGRYIYVVILLLIREHQKSTTCTCGSVGGQN